MSIVARIGLLLVLLGTVLALQPGSPAAAANVTVTAGPSGSPYGPFWFCSSSYSGSVCTTTITLGDTVTWQNTTSVSHTSTECDSVCGTTPMGPLWDSGVISPGGSYSRTFNQVGTFNYQCNIHPTQMKGQIVVSPSGTPTPGGHNGDVNKDGTTNAIDAALVLQYSAGFLSSINADADVNQDGRINSIDAALILQFVAGLIPSLPV